MGRKDEEKGLLEDGADPGYGSQRLDLCHKEYKLQMWPEDIDVEYISMDSLAYIRNALNERIPPICANGMQRMTTRVVEAAIEHAADIVDAGEHPRTPLSKEKGEAKLKRVYEKKQVATTLRDLWEQQEPPEMGNPAITAILLSSIWFALIGYNIGIFNVAEAFIFPDHSTFSWACAVASFPFGGLIGAYLGIPVANKYGRCPAFYIMTFLYLFGGVFQCMAPGMPIIQTTRIILGVAAGMASITVPVYLGEIVPPERRGKLGGMLQRSIASGLITSYIAPFLAEEVGWRAWVSVNAILPLIPLLQISNLVESPMWLLQGDPQSRAARVNLCRLRKKANMQEVELEALALARPVAATKPTEGRGFSAIVFKSSALQVTLHLSLVYAIFYYSNLMMSGFTTFPATATMVLGFVYFLAVAGSTRNSLLESNISRRQKLLASEAAMMGCAILLRLTWGDSTAVIVVLLAAYVGLFALVMNPLPKLVVVEEMDVSSVTRVSWLSIQVGWAAHALVVFVFPFLWAAVGKLVFEIIIWIMLVAMAATTALVPASVGKTPKQYYALLRRQRPTGSLHA